MASERSPAFQFYPADFLSDHHVIAMNLAERGAYITLLCVCWMQQTIPSEPMSLARLCGVSGRAFAKLWPALEPCFQLQGMRYVQPRIERERKKQDEFRRMKAEAGQKGGRRQAEGKQKPSRHEADTVAESSPPSSSSSSVFDLPSSERTKTDALRARFDRFWAYYPRKVGKDAAWKAWQKVKPDDELVNVMLATLAWQKQQDRWLEENGRFVPNPATWINQGRWTDEPLGMGEKPPGSEQDAKTEARASHLLERYQELYREHRKGARTLIKPALDHQRACDLCRVWDDARLEKMAIILLTTDEEWVQRTDRGFGVFCSRATWADDRLRQWELQHGFAK